MVSGLMFTSKREMKRSLRRNGRRTGLKILSSKGRMGSTPIIGTRPKKVEKRTSFFYLSL